MADEEQVPDFGDVVKMFTPPGTDFEAFKASLHSEGAPGRVSPQLVAMLNQAAAAGAIPRELVEHTGEACIRCDHRHAGGPGKTCLEAEAHLGRSPDRRRPDVQLDAISGPQRPPGTTEQALRDADALPLNDDLTERLRSAARGSSASLCPDPSRSGHGTGCMCGSRYLQRADAARASTQNPYAPLPEPDFPPGMPSVSAVAAHEQYLDFRRAGFTLDEAVKLLASLIAASKTDNSNES